MVVALENACSSDQIAGSFPLYLVQAAVAVLDRWMQEGGNRPRFRYLEDTTVRYPAVLRPDSADSHLEGSLLHLVVLRSRERRERQEHHPAAVHPEQHLLLLQTHTLDQRKHAFSYRQAEGHLEGDQEARRAGTAFRNPHSSGLVRFGRSHLERVGPVEGMIATSWDEGRVLRFRYRKVRSISNARLEEGAGNERLWEGRRSKLVVHGGLEWHRDS